MSRKTLIYIAGGLMSMLGLLHLIAQIGMMQSNQMPAIMLDMEQFKIEMMGTHTLLKFHNGFSIMMGFLLCLFGSFILITATIWLDVKSKLLFLIIMHAIMLIISISYFHVLAYRTITLVVLCLVTAYLKPFEEQTGKMI
jgi:hypothetical protein